MGRNEKFQQNNEINGHLKIPVALVRKWKIHKALSIYVKKIVLEKLKEDFSTIFLSEQYITAAKVLSHVGWNILKLGLTQFKTGAEDG